MCVFFLIQLIKTNSALQFCSPPLRRMISRPTCVVALHEESLKMLNLFFVEPHWRPQFWREASPVITDRCTCESEDQWVRRVVCAWYLLRTHAPFRCLCFCVLQPQPNRQQKRQGTAPWHIPLGISVLYCLLYCLAYFFYIAGLGLFLFACSMLAWSSSFQIKQQCFFNHRYSICVLKSSCYSPI